MTTDSTSAVLSSEPNHEGYREFTVGNFHFRRDEYFARVTWPTGEHTMSIDDFLRAVQRDVAWDFFYGTVNFDAVVGTVNHYGTVDLFAGSFNQTYRTAERDYVFDDLRRSVYVVAQKSA